MASPQKENGYTPIANDLMDALCKTRIPGQARQVFDCIARMTYGWRKKESALSLRQLSEATGLNKVRVCRAVNTLHAMHLITKIGNASSLFTKNGNDTSVTYSIQKDFDKWRTLPKMVTSKHVTKNGNVTLPKMVTNEGSLLIKDKTKYKEKILCRAGIPFDEIVSYLNEKAGKSYRSKSKKTKEFITARWKEEFTLEDFKRVIDNRCSKWLTDPKYCEYLRPETLFGTKFEGYLNDSSKVDGKIGQKTAKTIVNSERWMNKEE